MIFWIAFLICSTGIAGLFFLDRDSSTHNSKALWLPVMWLGIAGSRPVSSWFGTGSGGGIGSTLDGSPLDAAVFAVLVVAGLIVLFRRRGSTPALLKASAPIVIFLTYCLMSVAWSPFPEPAFKRWTKAVGDLVMVLVILTDGQPIAALRRLYSRLGFVLFPTSILLIRYTDLGRGYDPDGNPMNTGVTTNKNTLGLIVFTVALGALWNARALLLDKEAPNRGRRLVAQGTLLAFGLVLLEMAHSATSAACFVLGGGLMLATSLRVIRSRPSRVRSLCLMIVLVGGLSMLFGGGALVSDALGRGNKMSGRTDIWSAVLQVPVNPIIGTGFESFWNAHSLEVARILVLKGFLNMPDLVSAHNGYLEAYLDLGLVGAFLIVLVLISGYRNASKAFQHNPEFASLMLAYITTSTFYNITEAGFRLLTPSWIFLLLAVVSVRGLARGLFGGEAPGTISLSGLKAGEMRVGTKLVSARPRVYTARRG
jgi:exopolysaccharide production protein ExoQ